MFSLVMLFMAALVTARDDGLRTPPMGWMSWERFGCQKDCATHPTTCISSKLFEEQASNLVSKGFLAAGYDRINIDDCYMDSRDPNTNDLRADQTRFPGGIPALSAKIHSMGLKFGVYNDVGRGTCAGNPGLNVSMDSSSDAQLQRDVALMAHKWQIDSIKVDGCGGGNSTKMGITYPKLGKFLNASGRQILYTCSWPVYTSLQKQCGGRIDTDECFPLKSIVRSCSTWRVYKDIMDAYNLPGHAGVRQLILWYARNNATLRKASGPGHFNDFDMILAGDEGLSFAEAKIQFSMWCMFAAPLLMSNDLRRISPAMVGMLTNEEVIAIDQDPLGRSAEGYLVVNNTNVMSAQVSVWHKPLVDGGTAVALLNMGLFDASSFNLTYTAAMIGLEAGREYSVRDLWAHADLPRFRDAQSVWLDPNEVVMLKFVAVSDDYETPYLRH